MLCFHLTASPFSRNLWQLQEQWLPFSQWPGGKLLWLCRQVACPWYTLCHPHNPTNYYSTLNHLNSTTLNNTISLRNSHLWSPIQQVRAKNRTINMQLSELWTHSKIVKILMGTEKGCSSWVYFIAFIFWYLSDILSWLVCPPSSIFEPCHEIIAPGPFVKSCRSHICNGGNNSCSSLEAYATECAKRGVCINWRNATKGECGEINNQ